MRIASFVLWLKTADGSDAEVGLRWSWPCRDTQNKYFSIQISIYQMLSYPDTHPSTNMASFLGERQIA